MKGKRQLKFNDNNLLEQTKSRFISPYREKIWLTVNNFTAGDINHLTKTFHCVPRSWKNVFNLFGGGLGLNAELLSRYDFDFIEIPFADTILRTTKEKWIRCGTLSPFSNHRVDKQIILPLSQINMDFEEAASEKEDQLSLFGV